MVKFFTERVARSWNRLTRKAMESPSLEVKTGTWVSVGLGSAGLLVGPKDLNVFF